MKTILIVLLLIVSAATTTFGNENITYNLQLEGKIGIGLNNRANTQVGFLYTQTNILNRLTIGNHSSIDLAIGIQPILPFMGGYSPTEDFYFLTSLAYQHKLTGLGIMVSYQPHLSDNNNLVYTALTYSAPLSEDNISHFYIDIGVETQFLGTISNNLKIYHYPMGSAGIKLNFTLF